MGFVRRVGCAKSVVKSIGDGVTHGMNGYLILNKWNLTILSHIHGSVNFSIAGDMEGNMQVMGEHGESCGFFFFPSCILMIGAERMKFGMIVFTMIFMEPNDQFEIDRMFLEGGLPEVIRDDLGKNVIYPPPPFSADPIVIPSRYVLGTFFVGDQPCGKEQRK